MSHVSSIAKSSYPYRTTLAELDTNGDGVVSQQEIAAAQRPGLLKRNSEGDAGTPNPLSNVMAVLMNVGNTGSFAGGLSTADDTGDDDMQASVLAYRNTYGQYDLDGATA
jgi:hypothetical protein